MGRKFGLSFSWRRASGLSAAKGKISRRIGVPLTRQGRQRKVGRAAGCFVATAVYGNDQCEEVVLLRSFRDDTLKKTRSGRVFIFLYYIFGPYLAWVVKKIPVLKCLALSVIDRIVKWIK